VETAWGPSLYMGPDRIGGKKFLPAQAGAG
jgi:hypothetical protein